MELILLGSEDSKFDELVADLASLHQSIVLPEALEEEAVDHLPVGFDFHLLLLLFELVERIL